MKLGRFVRGRIKKGRNVTRTNRMGRNLTGRIVRGRSVGVPSCSLLSKETFHCSNSPIFSLFYRLKHNNITYLPSSKSDHEQNISEENSE
jgi:hypothetical protein